MPMPMMRLHRNPTISLLQQLFNISFDNRIPPSIETTSTKISSNAVLTILTMLTIYFKMSVAKVLLITYL